MSYLETFLEEYYDHIENYEALLFVLSLLPDAYKYQFVRNLLKYDSLLEEGSVLTDEKLDGMIKINDDSIILKCNSLPSKTLLKLPPIHEI